MVEETAVVVDNQGIGYRILVPQSLPEQLGAPGSEVKIYTYLNVREDAMQLFGFGTLDELEVFQQLITVSGIGPKGGLNILGVLSADDIRFAVLAEDAGTIAKAPGIGAKTAKKLIVELKDKLKMKDVVESALERSAEEQTAGASPSGRAVSEAVEALAALGYSATDAMRAIRRVESYEALDTGELLKQALKNM